jgi:tetratricopeptide (TPR) repeat protein
MIEYFAKLGDAFYNAGKFSDAEPLFKLALSASDRPGNRLEPGVKADIMTKLATSYKQSGKFSEAATFYQLAEKQYQLLEGPTSLNVAHCLLWLGEVRLKQRQDQEAERLFRKALGIALKSPRPNDLEVACALRCLAGAKLAEKNYSESEALFRRALSIYEKLADSDPALRADTLNEISSVLRCQNRTALADQFAAQAKAIKGGRK